VTHEFNFISVLILVKFAVVLPVMCL